MSAFVDLEAYAPVHGDPIIEVELDGGPTPSLTAAGPILIGVDRGGLVPPGLEGDFDLLLTTAPAAARPWISVPEERLGPLLGRLREAARTRPLAASVLAQVLRVGERLPFPEALVVESLGYSTLLGGPEFQAWLASRSASAADAPDTRPRVRYEREGDAVTIVLAAPERQNAFDACMRDDLVEALRAVVDDPSAASLTLRGEGRVFSTGGDLGEFGTAADTATAHAIRTLRAPALLLHQLRDRATAYVHGACVGSGIEVPAAAGRMVARPETWFQLPELRMGLIPGAGGTATISRRIGRHRTLYLVLTGKRLAAREALEWGLVDAMGEAC